MSAISCNVCAFPNASGDTCEHCGASLKSTATPEAGFAPNWFTKYSFDLPSETSILEDFSFNSALNCVPNTSNHSSMRPDSRVSTKHYDDTNNNFLDGFECKFPSTRSTSATDSVSVRKEHLSRPLRSFELSHHMPQAHQSSASGQVSQAPQAPQAPQQAPAPPNAAQAQVQVDPNGTGRFGESEADALVACDGNCGAELPRLLKKIRSANDEDFNAMMRDKGIKKILQNNFCTFESPVRRALVRNIEKIDDEQRKQYFTYKGDLKFCQVIFEVLQDDTCIIFTSNDIVKVLHFLRILSINNAFIILSKLANVTCKYGQRSLMQECKENMEQDQKNHLVKESVWQNILADVEKILQKQIYKDTISKGYKLSIEEVMAVYLYCYHDDVSNGIRSSHRLKPNTCKWKKLYQCICSAVIKLHSAHHSNYGPNDRINELDSLFHGCPVSDPNIKGSKQGEFRLHTITSFSSLFEVAYSFQSTGSGVILQLKNVTQSLRDGTLIAADVGEISPHAESEWIVLPITFLGQKNIVINPNICTNGLPVFDPVNKIYRGNWKQVQQISNYKSVDVSHTGSDMDDVTIPFVKYLNLSKKEEQRALKRYDACLVTLGLFVRIVCSVCKQRFRFIDFRGHFAFGDFRCPCCLAVQYGGLQRINELVECLKCKKSAPLRMYSRNENSRAAYWDEKVCPNCRTPAMEALKFFHENDEKFQNMIEEACQEVPEMLADQNAQLGLYSDKLCENVKNNINNLDYSIEDFLFSNGTALRRLVQNTVCHSLAKGLINTYNKNGGVLTKDSVLDFENSKLKLKCGDVIELVKFIDMNFRFHDPYTMKYELNNLIPFLPELIYFTKLSPYTESFKYYRPDRHKRQHNSVDQKQFETLKFAIEGLFMPLLMAPKPYHPKKELSSIESIVNLYDARQYWKMDESLRDNYYENKKKSNQNLLATLSALVKVTNSFGGIENIMKIIKGSQNLAAGFGSLIRGIAGDDDSDDSDNDGDGDGLLGGLSGFAQVFKRFD